MNHQAMASVHLCKMVDMQHFMVRSIMDCTSVGDCTGRFGSDRVYHRVDAPEVVDVCCRPLLWDDVVCCDIVCRVAATATCHHDGLSQSTIDAAMFLWSSSTISQCQNWCVGLSYPAYKHPYTSALGALLVFWPRLSPRIRRPLGYANLPSCAHAKAIKVIFA